MSVLLKTQVRIHAITRFLLNMVSAKEVATKGYVKLRGTLKEGLVRELLILMLCNVSLYLGFGISLKLFCFSCSNSSVGSIDGN